MLLGKDKLIAKALEDSSITKADDDNNFSFVHSFEDEKIETLEVKMDVKDSKLWLDLHSIDTMDFIIKYIIPLIKSLTK